MLIDLHRSAWPLIAATVQLQPHEEPDMECPNPIKSPTMTAGLPNDALVEILSLLPVKPLHKSKCVAQSWHDLIDDPLLRRKLVQTLEGFFVMDDGNDWGHFNFINLLFRIISVPKVAGWDPGYVAQSQGRLHYLKESQMCDTLSIWVLKDYGTHEWVLLDTINVLNLFETKSYLGGEMELRFVGIHPDRNVVFLTQISKRQLMSYDMDSKEASVIGTHGNLNWQTDIVPYVPSFSKSPVPKYGSVKLNFHPPQTDSVSLYDVIQRAIILKPTALISGREPQSVMKQPSSSAFILLSAGLSASGFQAS
ncbi:hypothetical protein EJB05_14714, partial [Eragrostis curvula]